jgi:hypothetical protein
MCHETYRINWDVPVTKGYRDRIVCKNIRRTPNQSLLKLKIQLPTGIPEQLPVQTTGITFAKKLLLFLCRFFGGDLYSTGMLNDEALLMGTLNA